MARITNMRWERLAARLPFLLLLALTHAQPPPPSESRSTWAKTFPRVDIGGCPNVTLKRVQDLISVSPGKPLSQKDVDSGIAPLNDVVVFRRRA
jgi:hypothetical protein